MAKKRRWSREPRGKDVPEIEAMMLGLSPEEIQALKDLVDQCDGDYNALMARLRYLNAEPSDYRNVNRTAKQEMGKSSTDMDLLNPQEIKTWQVGYEETREGMDNLADPAGVTRRAFLWAKRMTGWQK